MAAHMHSLTVGGPDAAVRRVSAPHIPLMVVVTDVDGKPGNCESSMQISPESSPNPNVYSRISKGILKSESSDPSIKDPSSSASISPASSSKKVSVSIDRDVVKPITKWRRICKCFIGLKMTKKNGKPNSAQPGKSGGGEKSGSLHPVPVVRRSRSHSLHPGVVDPNSLSVSPARSIRSIRSSLSARSETDFYLFDMGDMSEILTITDIKQIGKSFPPSAVGCPCILTFSTSMDGYSLHTLYRKMEKVDSPMILAILDSEGRAFGAVLSCALRVSEHFYGSCDSFLFRCDPTLEVFKAVPDGNFYFIHSEESFLRIGAGKGNCGIWLDDNLYHGRTEECATFNSTPLVPEMDFEVAAVEVWTFGQI